MESDWVKSYYEALEFFFGNHNIYVKRPKPSLKSKSSPKLRNAPAG